MGMDIHGRNPRTEAGEYFQMKIFRWPLLWQYCEVIAPDIIPEDNGGYYNDGWGLNDEKSIKLGQRLQQWFDSGDCEKWKEEVEQAHTKLVSNPCPDCAAEMQVVKSGLIDFAQGNNLDSHKAIDAFEADHRSASVNTRNIGYVCGTCCGTQIKSEKVIERTFEVDRVPPFIEFLLNCGGFKIW